MTYKYITENNLLSRQNYMYSEYGAMSFLRSYMKSRQEILALDEDSVPSLLHVSYNELNTCMRELQSGEISKEIKALIDVYVKGFEVRKRIYTEYNENWKPVEGAGFEDYEVYLLLADCLTQVWNITKCTKYVSCLLKLDDTMISIRDKMMERQKRWLSDILRKEVEIYKEIALASGVSVEE